MNIAEQAFLELFPEKEQGRELSVRYSGKFSGYNANVKYTPSKMVFGLSRQWKGVSREIQIGVIQSLLLKVYGEKMNTINIDMYNIFLKKVHQSVEVKDSDPMLLRSFSKVNEAYFSGMIDMPNLRWGNDTVRKLGSYDYGKDTITISTSLKDDPELLDYVMHHEMLHKKLKYSTKNGRSYHHTTKFREAEKKFHNHALLEKKLNDLVVKKRLRKAFSFW